MRAALGGLTGGAVMAALLVAGGGCGTLTSTPEPVCQGAPALGIQVDVRNAVTNAPAADSAVGTATEGGYSETLQVVGYEGGKALTLGGIQDRGGTYTVTVQRAGFATWSKSGVVVMRNTCGVAPVHLDARLTPTG
jgi:hypothetical protein